MERLLQGLNGEQRQAVLHDHATQGPLLVLAGAGSGKTSVLTRRIQYRIAQGVLPEKILALTFTAKAAAEMAERVHQLFPEAGVRLCTFHSLALHILRSRVLEVDNWRRMGFACAPVPSESASAHWQDSLVAQKLKAGSLDREELFAPNLPIAGGEATLQALCIPVLRSGCVVFEDLIWLAIRLLTEFPDVAAWARSTWHEILVDEYQDINPSQYRLIQALLGGRTDLFVVGDDDQAIYGFRGADIGNIYRFQADFPACRILRLEWNYRSTPRILEVANRIFADKAALLRKTLRPGAARPYSLFRENRRPEIWLSQTPLEEMERLVHAIREFRMEYDLAWRDFAILVRYNRQRLYYRMALQEWSIPLEEVETENAVVDGVHVETIHASKGLQYPVVFYAGLAVGLSPGEITGNRHVRKAQLGEEKRLFYVGVTRAEAHLILMFCRSRHWRGHLRRFRRSPYLNFATVVQPHRGLPMPVFIFKVLVVIRVLLYLAGRMPSYLYTRIFRSSETHAWIERNAELWCQFCLRVMRLDLRLEGQEKLALIDWTRPVIVVANHESYADIPVVILAVGRILGFLAKRELGYIPFLAYWMRQIGCLFIDRRKKGVGGEVSQKITGSGDKTHIVIFPEGTRSKTGAPGPFKSGAFRLACELGATLLPIVHSGTREGWEDRKNSQTVQTVRARVLDPIHVAAMQLQKSVSPKSDLLVPLREAIVKSRSELGRS